MKKLAALLLVLTMIFALVACSGCKNAQNVCGRYAAKTIDGKSVRDYLQRLADETGLDFDTFLLWMEIEKADLDEFLVLELKKDKTAVMSSSGEPPVSGAWKLDGNKLLVTIEGDDIPREFTWRDGEIVFTAEEGGETHELVLVKQDDD